MKIEIIEEQSKDHWLELRGSECSELVHGKETPIWNVHIVCKWDGCVDYRSYSNGYGYNHECEENCQCCEDYIHICDMDSFIKNLVKVKKMASGYYKGKQGEEYWTDSNLLVSSKK